MWIVKHVYHARRGGPTTDYYMVVDEATGREVMTRARHKRFRKKESAQETADKINEFEKYEAKMEAAA